MADNVIGRTTIEIVGDTSRYNSSIDAAVQRTALMQARQRALTQELEENQRKLDVSSRGLASNTSARERNAAAIQRAIAQYGQESTQVQRLLQAKASLERTTTQLTQRIETFRAREQALTSQLTSVNQALAQQAANNGRVTTSSNTAASSLGTMSQRLGSMMSMLKSMLAMRATRSFLEATIGGLSQFEQYETSFAVMLGDMQAAKDLMSDLQDFAAHTPYQLPDVTKAAQLLMNYGVEAKDLITTMTHLGDLSQGQAEKLDRISLAYGQMLAKGKVTGEELRQMTEAGVPLTQALADNMGIATSELMKFIGKGEVGIPELNSAIEGLTTGTGKFAGMMEQQSQTLAGQWSTLKDNMGAFAREIGEEAFAETKSALSGISKEFAALKKSGELSALAKQWGSVFATLTRVVLGGTKILVEHKEAVGALIVAYGAWKVVQQGIIVYQAYKTAVEGATAAQAALTAVTKLNPLIALAGVLTTVIGGIVALSKATDDNVESMKRQQKELENLQNNTMGYLANYSDAYGQLTFAAESLLPRIRDMSAELQDANDQTENVSGKKALLKDMINQVNEVLGEEALAIDDVTGELIDNTGAIDDNIEARKRRALADAANKALEDLYEQQAENALVLVGYEQDLAKLTEQRGKIEEDVNKKIEQNKGNGGWQRYAEIRKPLTDLDQQIGELNRKIESGTQLDEEYSKSIQKMSDVYNEIAKDVGDVGESIDALADPIEDNMDLMANLENSEKRLKTLATAQKEAANDGKLSISTLRQLGDAYASLQPFLDDYMAGVIDEKELIAQFPALYQEESAQYSATMMSKYKDNETFFANLKSNNATLFSKLAKDYQGDKSNWKTLAQAKAEIESKLITALSGQWQEYYRKVGGNATKTVEAMQTQITELTKQLQGPQLEADPLKEFAKRKNIKDEIEKIKRMVDAMQPLTELEGAFEMNLKDFDPDAGNTEKKKKESAKKEKTWQEKLYAELKYEREMGKKSEKEYLDGLVKIRDSYYGVDEENYRKYNLEIHNLQKKAQEQAKEAEKNKLKILQDAFDNQMDIAKDFYDKQKELVEEQSEAEIKAINDRYDNRLDKIKEEYEAEKERVDGIVDELQREIDAKKRARQEEKLDDDLSFAQTRLQNLQTQIQYARTPEEKAELEKELKRQQEDLKDLTVKKEVNELEAEKRIHQEQLQNLEDQYKEDEKWLEKKRKKALAIAEEARDQALKTLEESFKAFNTDLHATYKYVNDETLSVGQRFAAATNDALQAGFTKVSSEAQNAIDVMMAKVQDAVARLKSSVERSKSAYRSGTAVAYSNSDNRSMLVTNNISRGLTEGQVARLMDRQAERLLYGRR